MATLHLTTSMSHLQKRVSEMTTAASTLVQADMSLNEVGWNAVLASALLAPNVTIWAVTARCAIPEARYHKEHAISHQRGGNRCGGFERIRRDEVRREREKL